MKKSRRLLSLVLVLSMCFILAAMPAFADGSTVRYVALGDSCTNGYGFNDYYSITSGGNIKENDYGFLSRVSEIYPALLRDNYGLDTDILALSSMRMDDLYAVLNPDGYNSLYYTGGDSYMNYYIMDPVTFTGHFPDIYRRVCADVELSLTEYYNQKLQAADVITLSLGLTNLGTGITNRILDYLDEESRFEETINCAMQADINSDLLLKYYITKIEARLLPAELIGALATVLADVDMLENVISELKDALLYGFAGYCLYFKQIYNYMREINPNAEIIVLGLPNLMQGLEFDIAGIYQYKLGDRYQNVLDMAMQYMQYVIRDDANCYFADVGNLDTFANELKNCHGDPNLISDDYYNRFVQNLFLPRVHNYPDVTDDVKNVSLTDLVKFFRDIGANGEASPYFDKYGFFYQKFVETLDVYSNAVQSDTLDALDIIENREIFIDALEETNTTFGENDILTVIAQNKDAGWAKALTYMNARFQLADGVTVHPNEAGHRQIFNAIVNTGACLGQHDWCSIPRWTWNEDGTEAVMTLTCKNNCCHKVEVPAANISREVSGCTAVCTAYAEYEGHTYSSAECYIQLPHSYDVISGVCTGCGRVAPCTSVSKVELTEGSHVLALLNKPIGSYTFTKSGDGWTVMNTVGKYVSLSDGKLAYSDTPFTWNYRNSFFYADQQSASIVSKLSAKLFGKGITKTYYLTAVCGNLSATTVPTALSVVESYAGDHTYCAWHLSLSDAGKWTRSCLICGQTETSDSPRIDQYDLVAKVFNSVMGISWLGTAIGG